MIDLFENNWGINRIANHDADFKDCMHTSDNIELVLSGLNPFERKGEALSIATDTLSTASLPPSEDALADHAGCDDRLTQKRVLDWIPWRGESKEPAKRGCEPWARRQKSSSENDIYMRDQLNIDIDHSTCYDKFWTIWSAPAPPAPLAVAPVATVAASPLDAKQNKSKRATEVSPESTPAVKKMAVSATPGVSGGKIMPNFSTSPGPVATGRGRGHDQPAAAAMTHAGMTLAGPVAGPGPIAAGRGASTPPFGQGRTLMSFFEKIVQPE